MDWKYYNHAMIPSTAPHEIPDMTPVDDGSIWKSTENPLLARWTSDFDCGIQTEWWYCIKDTPFDVNTVNAKKRYEINKGKKNFDTRVICPGNYTEALYRVQVAAFSAYPEKYRPTVDKDKFIKDIENWNKYIVIGGFNKGTDELVSYALLQEYPSYADFKSLRSDPACERNGINAGMVAGILDYYNERIGKHFYICDGARSINHETAFQDYLEKYFSFRKAYCLLHIKYSPKIKFIVKTAYLFRKLLKHFDGKQAFHQLNSILMMEDISRRQKAYAK